MNTILVPCDGSDGALRAVRHAAAKARDPGRPGQVDLLYVMAPYYAVSFREPLAASQPDERFPQAARQALAPAAAILAEAGVEHSVHCRWGAAEAPEIVAHAAARGCQAIVMGTRGRSALASLLPGSVATGVAHTADIPVTLIK